MAETADSENSKTTNNKPVDLDQKMKKADYGLRRFSLRKYLTPYVTACISFSLLIIFHLIWAAIFGTDMGGQPQAILNINWVSPTIVQTFDPDANIDLQTLNARTEPSDLPRITASGNSKIIHLSDEMADALPDSFATTGKLLRAPLEDVVQFSKYGKLPKIGVLGAKPAEVYARPTPAFDGRPRIAIMITGLGIHHQATKKAIDTLPGEITFGFSPYGEGLQDWINRARENGHEVILQTPMEPFDFPDNDPGPSTLLADGDPDLNMSRFKWVMSRITGYIGITNFMGAKFTSKAKAISPILSELKKRGLYYVENGVLHRSKVSELSKNINLGFAKVDVIIDDKKTIANIENSLERIEKIAASTGMAFAIGSNLPATVEHIKQWVKTLEAKGFQLVPVSAKVKHDLKTDISTIDN
ncbi:MAG: divergent polysaccharide deacetylase family protein [Rhizobiales bacterium]|nr:divergent polysaccharide deacetylase family protein [Hyphomicrobiales bacterium]NRB14673.1 divergent polysaccharide deacetylase family protein [Hyphomicrobiales bacterium]